MVLNTRKALYKMLRTIMKTRLFFSSLIVCLCLTMLFSTVLFASEPISSGSCGDTIQYAITQDGILTLDGSGSIHDVTPSTIPWAEHFSSISQIVIPEGVTAIGIDAFLNLSVTQITIPESVILIGSHALGYYHDGENYLPIPDFTIVGKPSTEAESYATANGFLFKAISEPLPSGKCGLYSTWELSENGVLTISGTGAITDFTSVSATPWADYITGKDGFSISELVISPGITKIGNYAFANCRRLTSVTLPDGLSQIGTAAFSGCSEISSITIPGSVSTIGNEAFASCYSLRELTLSNGIVSIGKEAFSLSGLTNLTLPNSVEEIGAKAFYGCSSITTASMSGVHKVGIQAFEGCTALTAVTFGTSLSTISQSAFEGCEALTSLSFPASLTNVGNRAFYSCTALSVIQLPDSLKYLGEYAFYDCTSLSSVTIGSALTSIEEGTFENCRSLQAVTIGSSVSSLNERAFSGCSSLQSLLLPRSIRYIAPYAIGYRYYEDLENNINGAYEKLPGFTLEILGYIPSVAEQYATDNGFSFQSIGTIDVDGGNITVSASWSINTETGVLMINGSGRIPDYATFEDTPWALYRTYLKTVVIGAGILNVGASSFEDCTGIKSVTIANGVRELGDYAFSGTSLEILSLPKTLTTINDGVFEGCQPLRSVTLPDHLDLIGKFAFRDTPALKSIYIPESVTFIGDYAIGVTAGNAPLYGFLMKGIKGSIAENYAETNGINFREDGFVEITDSNSGASVTIVGEDSRKYNLTFKKIGDNLMPSVLLNANEYALVYDFLLTNDGVQASLDGSASICFPIPENVNSLAVTIYSYDENGVFTPMESQVENGYFVFTYHALGRFVITNADLTKLYTITVQHLYSDGTVAASPSTYRATSGTAYQFNAATFEGFEADHSVLSGKVETYDLALSFTYWKVAASTQEIITSEPPITDDDREPLPPNNNRIMLIILEVVLILALLAAVAALIILNMKKKREENEKDAIATDSVRKGVIADKFADTIVVPDAPTQEIDIQSLFADEPEEDTAAIIEILNQKKAEAERDTTKNTK